MKNKNTQNKPTSYALSENSIKTKNEFGEANAVYSLLYNRFKQVTSLNWNAKKLNQFRRLILEIIRSAPAEQTGNRKLWDGDFKKLEGIQLNIKNSADNLFKGSVITDIDPIKGFNLSIHPFKYHTAFPKAHPKTTFAEVRLYIFAFDIVKKTSHGRSIILLSQRHGMDMDQTFNFNYPLEDNKLTLIVRKVSFKSGSDNSYSADRMYIGATLTNAIYIKNGELVNFIPEKKKNPLKN